MTAIIKSISFVLVMLGLSNAAFAQTSSTLHTVLIEKMKFIPENIHVKKGDTVVWVNKDFYPHNVSKYDDNTWHSPNLNKDETWYRVVKESEDYYCSLHVVMRGKLIVEK